MSLIFLPFCRLTLNAENSAQNEEETAEGSAGDSDTGIFGGGYALSGQVKGSGYSYKIYDSSNGLSTSESMCILGSRDGYVYIGGYSGVMRYDGSEFERLDASKGITSARIIFEDSRGRIWVGTNDNGVVAVDGENSIHYTYKDGLPSSSIRSFAEDPEGNIFIGTTTGLCYVDCNGELKQLSNSYLDYERILKLDADSTGRIYGQTAGGIIFAIEGLEIPEIYESSFLGIGNASTILADPKEAGKVYIGTENGQIYHGYFGNDKSRMKLIDVFNGESIHWINYDCGRVWVSSTDQFGYIDIHDNFRLVSDIPLSSGIEMICSDYQGNLWISSSSDGAVKIVANNFLDLTENMGIDGEVANAVLRNDDFVYLGTNNGLRLYTKYGSEVENELTEYIEDSRVRCLIKDDEGDVWVASYSNDKGLVRYSDEKGLKIYTKGEGLPDNRVRCIAKRDDGSLLVGTNGGIAMIKNSEIIKTIGSREGLKNTVILTVCESDDGSILAGTDGDGIYRINGDEITKISRDDGLTSDVIVRIIKDSKKNLHWIITSNSIEILKDGVISEISTFPYSNNYDIYFDDKGGAWVLSSGGIYVVDTNELAENRIEHFKYYSMQNGLPYPITGNSFSDRDADGNLLIPGRNGIIHVNIDEFPENKIQIKSAVKFIKCDNDLIEENSDGSYTIPPSNGRIQIHASVLDYSMQNPVVHLYLEGYDDEGVTAEVSDLSDLEYTSLRYGDYKFHIQIIERNSGEKLTDNVYKIVKKPRITELTAFRVISMLLLILAAGYGVWKYMKMTVIERQYEEIRAARDEAERANTAKTRFLANMSHEIRTPINTIMGMNEMISREDASGVPKGYFISMINYSIDIKNAAESLLGLINDILDISKIESGKMHLVEQEYEIVNVLRSVISMIRVKSAEKDLTFNLSIDENLPRRMYGDQGKIKQIILNILTNAVKYTKEGGFTLFATVLAADGEFVDLRFSVKDTGIGVKEEDMDKLFTAYERLEEERNSGIQGTGLGLDISRRFAELMNGKLWCESVYGEGSEFILTVRQKILDPEPIGEFKEHDENVEKGPYIPKFIAPEAEVLVVDDNSMNLNVMRSLLKGTEVKVTTASSGEEAIEKINASDFNIVLLDHMMPGMDGIETLETIRKAHPDLPVYALTANSTAGESFYKEKGFNGYLSKPVVSELLEETIMRHLPEEIVTIPDNKYVSEEITEIPEEYSWIEDVEGISTDEGIKNSGGIINFINSLKLFFDTIDANTDAITNAFENKDIRLFTIKVHSLKSSARIVGALELSVMAKNLEDAGNSEDLKFINENTDSLLKYYCEYKDKLSGFKDEEGEDSGKELISDDLLEDAYSTLKDCVSQMDYDAVETIVEELSQYRIPEKDAGVIEEFMRAFKLIDWDKMEEALKNQ